jgi:hypothetical protein
VRPKHPIVERPYPRTRLRRDDGGHAEDARESGGTCRGPSEERLRRTIYLRRLRRTPAAASEMNIWIILLLMIQALINIVLVFLQGG